ncbi:transposase, partial [Lacticaseibacillus paracasei]|uniref:transposase n=1 Tax=Lacticaseibacillus paracasei TaxID=1597 RepID=UPI0027301D54
MTKTGIRYTPEFKQTLIDLHHNGRSFNDLSAEHGPSQDTIRKWVQAATVVAIDAQGIAVTKEQFQQLQKENRRLKEENDILKQAAVLLAKIWGYTPSWV